jgi:hypothetical protein
MTIGDGPLLKWPTYYHKRIQLLRDSFVLDISIGDETLKTTSAVMLDLF